MLILDTWTSRIRPRAAKHNVFAMIINQWFSTKVILMGLLTSISSKTDKMNFIHFLDACWHFKIDC